MSVVISGPRNQGVERGHGDWQTNSDKSHETGTNSALLSLAAGRMYPHHVLNACRYCFESEKTKYHTWLGIMYLLIFKSVVQALVLKYVLLLVVEYYTYHVFLKKI